MVKKDFIKRRVKKIIDKGGFFTDDKGVTTQLVMPTRLHSRVLGVAHALNTTSRLLYELSVWYSWSRGGFEEWLKNEFKSVKKR